MNPLVRIIFRASIVGGFAALGSLVANAPGLDQADYLQALYLGYAGIMTYMGLGASTTLEPTLGIKSTPTK